MLRIMTPACFCLTLAIPLSTPVSAQTEAETQTLSRIIDTLCLDMVQALNGCETAVLLTSETDPDAADLLIFSDRRGSEPQSVLVVVRGIAYNGAWFGQSPVLEAGENGALLVAEEQIAIGRAPWMQSLTIVHREGEFLVAGHTYSTYDRIVGGTFSCDVNLLTGDWVVNADRSNPETGATTYDVSETGRVAGERRALADWSSGNLLSAPCEASLSAWFEAAPE